MNARLFLLPTALVALFACSSPAPEQSASDDQTTQTTVTATVIAQPSQDAASFQQQLAELEQQLLALEPHLGCQTNDQCQALPLGSKACGGPESHSALASNHDHFEQALQLGELHQQLAQVRNQVLGLMSDCALVEAPVYQCQQQACVETQQSIEAY